MSLKAYVNRIESGITLEDVLYYREWMGYVWFVHKNYDCFSVSELSTGFRGFHSWFESDEEDMIGRFQKMMYAKYETDEVIKKKIDNAVSKAAEDFGIINNGFLTEC